MHFFTNLIRVRANLSVNGKLMYVIYYSCMEANLLNSLYFMVDTQPVMLYTNENNAGTLYCKGVYFLFPSACSH